MMVIRAYGVSGGTVPPTSNVGCGWTWVVSATSEPLLIQGEPAIPVEWVAGRVAGPGWTFRRRYVYFPARIPVTVPRSCSPVVWSLYWLSYDGWPNFFVFVTVTVSQNTVTKFRILFVLGHRLTFCCRNYFFLNFSTPVYKMWIIQEPNTLELWNKLYFEEKRT